MKKFNCAMFFALCSLLLMPTIVSAVPVGSVTQNLTGSWVFSSVYFYSSFTDYDIRNNLGYVPDGFIGRADGQALYPFFETNITTGDVGSTFTINGSNYRYWDTMVNYVLTDGAQDWSANDVGLNDPAAKPFVWNFSESYEGNGIDFQGYIIDYLLLTINDLHKPTNYNDPNIWEATWTITIDGHLAPVPEPMTFLLLGAGALGLVGLKKKSNR